MRTTVTLDDDVADALRRAAGERGASFKDVLNDAVRAGLGDGRASRPYITPSRPMGARPGLDLTRALATSADLEDEETLRKLALRK